MSPDLPLARRFLALHPPPGTLLLLAVTGSHHYGFTSHDSDIDLKGLHAAPTRDVLGLRRPEPAHDVLEFFEGTECDLTTNELGPGLRLLLQGNGNMLERIFSPYQVVVTPWLEELRALAQASMSQRSYNHYRGYLHGMQKEHLRQDPPRAKSLLYTFRVTLTGVHLLRTGEIEASLPRLAPLYGFDDVLPLIEHKRASEEKGALPEHLAQLRERWPDLERALDDALAASALPEHPPNAEAIDAFASRLRLEILD
jgi:predicted nucleotidyltransferase